MIAFHFESTPCAIPVYVLGAEGGGCLGANAGLRKLANLARSMSVRAFAVGAPYRGGGGERLGFVFSSAMG